jgi:hypothetical protein
MRSPPLTLSSERQTNVIGKKTKYVKYVSPSTHPRVSVRLTWQNSKLQEPKLTSNPEDEWEGHHIVYREGRGGKVCLCNRALALLAVKANWGETSVRCFSLAASIFPAAREGPLKRGLQYGGLVWDEGGLGLA